MKKLLSFVFLISGSYHLAAQNAEIEVYPQITDVTIYTSSAELSLEKEVQLNQGKNTIVFTGLTPFIVENTINMSVSDKEVNIITVTEKINYVKEKKAFNEHIHILNDSIQKTSGELGLVKCKTDALGIEKGLLFKDESIGGVSKGVAVAEIEKAAVFFNKRYFELSSELFLLKEKEKTLNEKVEKYKRQLNELTSSSAKTTSEIIVTVNSTGKKKVKFNLKFLTSKGGWAPVYDFKYDGPNKPLLFTFRANVFNACGISWDDVNIKLSTADPIKGFDMPTLSNKDEKQTAQQVQVNYGNKTVEFKEVQVINTISEYNIAHKYSVPSDAKPYLVDVNNYTMNASFNYLLIPKLDPFGFLMAKIPDWNKYNLIPGTTNIYNMGSYMGKTFLNTYAENDTLSVFLGKDQNIQSTRKEKNTDHGRAIIGNSFVDKTNTDITIKNNFKENLNVEILDQVPIISSDDKAKLTVTNIDNALYNKEDGELKWNYNLKPGETVNINFNYEIKAPKEYADLYRHKKRKFRTVSCPAF